MKRKLVTALLSAAALSFATNAPAAEKVTLKLAHDLERQHIVSQALDFMSTEIEKLSNGDMKLRIYTNGQMGNARETMELLQTGGLDMTKGSSNLEAFAEVYSIFSLPYLFQSKEHHDKVVYGPVGREIMGSTKDKGFFALAAFDTGTRSFYTRKAIEKPADMTGQKIRVQPSPTSLKMVELMGGSPTPVAFNEIYTALQQGIVDGGENNIPTWVHTRHIEIAKVYSENEHTSVPDFLVISTKSWDALNDKQQEILIQAARTTETYQRDIWAKEMVAAREKAASLGGTIVKADKAAFRAAVQPLYDDYSKDPAHATLLKKISAVAE